MGGKGAQESGKGLAPPLGIVAQFFKVFLEREPAVFQVAAAGNEFSNGFDHGQIRAGVGVRLCYKRIESPTHCGTGGGVAF